MKYLSRYQKSVNSGECRSLARHRAILRGAVPLPAFGLTIALAAAMPAQAQASADATIAGPSRDDLITVTATGTALPTDESGQPVTVIGADEIAAIQGPDLARVLERAPGVTITRNGGAGGFTGVRVRGADAEQLLVLVDGVRVAEVAAPGGGFDFGNLTAGSIGKIELLRGSNSVVWGSQAIGGVMAITTAAPQGVTASAEYGANDSRYATASAGGSAGALSGALAGSYFRTDGFSAATIGSEPDGFRQYQGTGRLRADLAPGFALTATGRYARGRLEIDGYPPPTYFVFDDTAEYQKTREASGRIGALYDAGGLSLNAGLARSDTRRQLFDPALGPDSYYTTRGRSTRAELFGRAALPSAFVLDFGADSEWTRFSTTYDARARARLSSGHALLGWYGSRLTVAAGARIDDHSRFGSAVTLGANANLALNDAWRVRASYGEGFKAPTLFQLLSDYGNAALDPERSRSFDLGVERGERGGPLHFSLTAFRRDSRDLIDFVSCLGSSAPLCANRPFGTYDNVSRARAEGIEAELGARLGEHFSASAAYSYVHATDRATGNDLARRPRHALTLAGDWATPLGGLALGADLRLVSDSYDDAGNFTRLDGYALTTVRAALPLGQRFELFGRVENLFDVTYQTAAGYGTAGRSAFGGVRARF